MAQYHRDHNKSIFAHPFVVAVSVALCLLLLVSVINMIGKKKNAKEALVDYRSEYSRLEQQKAEIQTSLDNLTTEKGREQEIRERFPVVEEGEELIVIVEQEPELANEGTLDTEKKRNGFWRRLGF